MKAEPPPQRGLFASRSQATAFLRTWWRVVAADGSTVAYAPDEATARQIAACLKEKAVK